MCFSCAISRSSKVDLVTSIKLSGTGYDSFLGTYNGTSRFNMMTINEILSELLREPKNPYWFLRHLLFLQVETLPSRQIHLEGLRWDSLSLRWIPVPEWVLGIRSFSLIILLNHPLQEIQIHHLFGLSGLLSHSVFWNIFWCTYLPYFIDQLFSNSPMSVIRIFSEIPPRMMHHQ